MIAFSRAPGSRPVQKPLRELGVLMLLKIAFLMCHEASSSEVHQPQILHAPGGNVPGIAADRALIGRHATRALLQYACSDANDAQAVFSCINAVRLNPSVLQYSCQFTVSAATPVVWDDQLALAAQLHAEDQARNDKMSHYGSDGSRLDQRATRAGFPPNTALGENVAVGHVRGNHLLHDWMCSEGHRRTNMNCAYESLGVGVASGIDGKFFYTALFGCRQAPCFCDWARWNAGQQQQPLQQQQAVQAATPAPTPAPTPVPVQPLEQTAATSSPCGVLCTAAGNVYSFCNARSGACEACGLAPGQPCCPTGHPNICRPGLTCGTFGLCTEAATPAQPAALPCGRDCALDGPYMYCNSASSRCEQCGLWNGAPCCPQGHTNSCHPPRLFCGSQGRCTSCIQDCDHSCSNCVLHAKQISKAA